MKRTASPFATAHALLCTLMLAVGCDAKPPATAPAGPQPQSLPTIKIDLNGTPVTLQVANTEKQREVGLMYTKTMPADAGMIFVFPNERPRGFWMQNTPIDLDIVYIDYAGKVVSVKTMRAFDESLVPSDGPAMFAIELNAGQAAKLNIKAGQQITLPAGLTRDAR